MSSLNAEKDKHQTSSKIPPLELLQIIQLSDKGIEELENGNFQVAIEKLKGAYKRLPQPRNCWEQSLQICARITDAYLLLNEWTNAKPWAELALTCSTSKKLPFSRPYAEKQLGMVLYELKDMENAKLHLGAAILGGGKEIFCLAQTEGELKELSQSDIVGMPSVWENKYFDFARPFVTVPLTKKKNNKKKKKQNRKRKNAEM